MCKVLIADSCEEFSLALKASLGDEYETLLCSDGPQTMALAESWLPDIILLDLMLPGGDGLSMLQRLTQIPHPPKILTVSRFYSDYVADAVGSLGAVYAARKPCIPDQIAERIADLSQRLEPPIFRAVSVQGQITNMLLELGMPTKRNGFNYSRVAIMLLHEDRNRSITKNLYPEVGKQCNATSYQVERSIRSAIEAAWNQRNDAVWRNYFATGPDGLLVRPTNTEFLTRLANALEQAGIRVG